MSGTGWGEWGLDRDPFQGAESSYVSTATHEEAVARIRYAIETGLKRVCVRGEAGLGKSRVLKRAMAEARHPTRRLIDVDAGETVADCVRRLVEPLVGAAHLSSNLQDNWATLRQALERCDRQRLRVVIAVDHDERVSDDRTAANFWRNLEQSGSRLTIVNAGRGTDDASDADQPDLMARLVPLGFQECVDYLTEKLERAGRLDETFTPGALVALHSTSCGNPRSLERLAALAMLSAGLQRSNLVDREAVEQLSRPGLVA